MITIAVCLLTLATPANTNLVHYCPTSHGGQATPVAPARGGAATPLLNPVRKLIQWMCIHKHEGAWSDDTGNGYYGGLQMDYGFIHAYGRAMIRKYHDWRAGTWSPRDQMRVANAGYDAGRGFYPWPNTARACGYI